MDRRPLLALEKSHCRSPCFIKHSPCISDSPSPHHTYTWRIYINHKFRPSLFPSKESGEAMCKQSRRSVPAKGYGVATTRAALATDERGAAASSWTKGPLPGAESKRGNKLVLVRVLAYRRRMCPCWVLPHSCRRLHKGLSSAGGRALSPLLSEGRALAPSSPSLPPSLRDPSVPGTAIPKVIGARLRLFERCHHIKVPTNY